MDVPQVQAVSIGTTNPKTYHLNDWEWGYVFALEWAYTLQQQVG